MGNLKEFKKYSLTIAGAVFAIYAAIMMLSGVHGVGVVTSLALLGVGICCFIEKTEPVRAGLLALTALLSFFSLIGAFFNFVQALFSGWLNFFTFIVFVAGLLTSAIRIVALVGLGALVFFGWKNSFKALQKFWFVPAILTLAAAVIDGGLTFLNVIAYGFYFKVIFRIALSIIIAVIYAVAQAALGLSTVDDESAEVSEVATVVEEPAEEAEVAPVVEELAEEAEVDPVVEETAVETEDIN